MLAICAALSWEVRTVLQALKQVQRLDVEGIRVWRGQAAQPVLVFRTGMGPQTAARSTEIVLGRFEIRALINTGCAGGLDPSLLPGVRIIPSVILTDGQAAPDLVSETLAARLRELARGDRFGTSSAPLYTVKRPLGSIHGKKALFDDTGAAAVDMESFTVGKVARDRSVAFAAVRVILDDFSTRLPEMEGITGTDGAIRPLRIATSLMRDPSRIKQFIEVSGMARTAQKSLADYFRVALRQPALIDIAAFACHT